MATEKPAAEKICPREPTQEMIAAAMRYMPSPAGISEMMARGVWRAMYDAAPAQPPCRCTCNADLTYDNSHSGSCPLSGYAPSAPEPRPHLRADGIPTRADMRFWTRAETMIADVTHEVESMGASTALTDAVVLLQQVRDRVADHVEQIADPAPASAPDVAEHKRRLCLVADTLSDLPEYAQWCHEATAALAQMQQEIDNSYTEQEFREQQAIAESEEKRAVAEWKRAEAAEQRIRELEVELAPPPTATPQRLQEHVDLGTDGFPSERLLGEHPAAGSK